MPRLLRVLAACCAVSAASASSPPPAPEPTALPLPPPRFPATSPLRPLQLQLPTDNRALLEGRLPDFYMGVDRTTDGQTRLVWEGGQYGFVRNPLPLGDQTVFTRFHEGLDIAPVSRDSAGEPLDLVRPIAPGRVVFINPESSRSNYGKHVIIEHDSGCGPLYSLYAHLMTISVAAGDAVIPESTLGRLGYTGSGLDRRRAHLHLELNLLLSSRFQEWHARLDPVEPARTGYHGFNLVGLDLAALYLALEKDPALTIPAFLQNQSAYFQVTAPADSRLPEILVRYPWLCPQPLSAETPLHNASWTISLTASGLPLRLQPSDEVVPYPVVSSIVPFHGKHGWKTQGRVEGTGTAASLSRKGTDYIRLILGQF